MTIVINDNCESITVDSVYLVDTNQSASLRIQTNCEEEYLVDIDTDDTEISITPTTINMPDLDVLPDGVYLFELTTVDEDGVINIERKCKLVNCGLNCLMIDAFKGMAAGNSEDTVKSLAYYALLNSEGCSECSCDDLCLLYNTTKLAQCSIYATGCGCS